MTDPDTFQQVQNGQKTKHADGLPIMLQPVVDSSNLPLPLYLQDGRGLAALTHSDVLYQEFLMAYLLLDSLGVPLNPGNPYNASKKQNGFNTFGGPDIASVLAAVANVALNVVWYQKWYVHLRHRPESGGALVYQRLDPSPLNITEASRDLKSTVLNSNAVKTSFNHHWNDGVRDITNSYFLSQAFPEGSPYRPAYPTGHGTVAGACITVLKFFYDADLNWKMATKYDLKPHEEGKPQEPSNDGTTLNTYGGSDVDQMTVNGELHKLAHNVSLVTVFTPASTGAVTQILQSSWVRR